MVAFGMRWLGLAGLGFVIIGCSQDEVVEATPSPRPAKLIEIAATDNTRNLSFPAIVEASSSVDLTFQVSGLIEDVAVTEGDEVTNGQVIARLDQRDFRNNLATMQAQYNSAQSEYERAERLLAQDAISRSIYEQRESQRDVARANLDSARKALDDTVLRSPFDGVVAVVQAVDFQNIGAQQNVVTLQTTGAAEAVVQIPATLVANSGRVEPVETVLVLDAAPDQRIDTELFSTTTQADTQTQTFEVRFAFTPPDNLLILPGMTGTVESRLLIAAEDGTTDQIVVPLSSIVAEGGETFVWLVDTETMTVSRQGITVDEGNEGIGEGIAVTSGLAPGDVIVGAGSAFLHEGMQIRRFEQ
ncbi:MAG: efflux RND transporter periplasmic adaptor subunit [Pseudomonadota bacterium]